MKNKERIRRNCFMNLIHMLRLNHCSKIQWYLKKICIIFFLYTKTKPTHNISMILSWKCIRHFKKSHQKIADGYKSIILILLRKKNMLDVLNEQMKKKLNHQQLTDPDYKRPHTKKSHRVRITWCYLFLCMNSFFFVCNEFHQGWAPVRMQQQ